MTSLAQYHQQIVVQCHDVLWIFDVQKNSFWNRFKVNKWSKYSDSEQNNHCSIYRHLYDTLQTCTFFFHFHWIQKRDFCVCGFFTRFSELLNFIPIHEYRFFFHLFNAWSVCTTHSFEPYRSYRFPYVTRGVYYTPYRITKWKYRMGRIKHTQTHSRNIIIHICIFQFWFRSYPT